MLLLVLPLAVVAVGVIVALGQLARAAEEARRLGHAAGGWADLGASWASLRPEARELQARLARRRHR